MKTFAGFRNFLSSVVLISLIGASAACAGDGDFQRRFEALGIGNPAAVLGTYVVPNEVQPALEIPILSHAGRGAYVTVGTERAFISAALAGSDWILVLDRDPGIIRYNRINTFLLKTSYASGVPVGEMRERYLRLRLFGTAEDWLEAAGPGADAKEVRSAFAWWDKEIRRSKSASLRVFQEPPRASERAAFREANYLFDDRLFARVQNFAVKDRILSAVVDLSDAAKVAQFGTLLEEAGIEVAVFDISNAWYEQYLGRRRTAAVLDALDSHHRLRPNSIFLMTDHHNRTVFMKNGEVSKQPLFLTAASLGEGGYHEEYLWSYHGYSVDSLRGPGGSIQVPRPQTRDSSWNDVSYVAPEPSSIERCRDLFRKIVPKFVRDYISESFAPKSLATA